ncbi:hypothetical protein HLB44_34005 [Aquincola sp. S2]|uniref:AMP-dependent synthetase/ligase domain-containing protein n=1 Tax=Pseudaquabacterium terrae TaxID=2732868 RepID=A0ABX2EU73_9BURK|nr:hypothetical protein [Aquabacterium terrae]NRF72011.1 hypothetical protein [Aquabacterium terrae]
MTLQTHDPRTPGELASRWAVALLRLPGATHPFTVSLRDIEADTAWARRVFEHMGLQRGQPAHLIGAGFDYAILWPYENALIGLGVPFGVAEPVAIDAPRTDMLLRRLRMQAVIGLTGEIVAALLALGRDLRALLGHSTLAALPDAAAVLRDAGLKPWTLLPLGPLWAFEPPEGGGADYDRSEWRVESIDGELVVTSVAERATPWQQLRTGVRGIIAADGRVLHAS